ncbi:MAG: hypothetical protein CBB72_000755 [Muricauda sp. TMED12]|nr:MAG: hypothetical protein CBB72_000755 [Muricauda sp. TMED12]
MRTLQTFFVTLILAISSNIHYAQTLEVLGAKWFNGNEFVESPLYIENGKFLLRKPQAIDESIDLSGNFLIPTLTETHTHAFNSLYDLETFASQYIEKGILHVQVLGGSYKGQIVASKVLKNYPLNIKYSNSGITCTNGHPFTIYEPLAMGIHDPKEKRNRSKEIYYSRLGENDSYWFMDNLRDVEEKWPQLIKTNPDAIKIMLLNVKHYDSLYNYKGMMGGKGVSKEVANEIVRLSHSENLNVFAHIETADDFHFALDIGVDVIAHIPGYAYKGNEAKKNEFFPSQSAMKKAARDNISVVTTCSLAKNYAKDYLSGQPTVNEQRLGDIIKFQKELIKELIANGVNVLIGTDQYGKTLFEEVAYLSENNILDNLSILKIITQKNSQAIFPNKRIGLIDEGYEGNFIVLEGNPIDDITYLKMPTAVYFGGHKL